MPARLSCLLLLLPLAARADDLGPVARWKLAGDANDSSGNGLHGAARSVDLAAAGPDGGKGGAAGFDGRKSVIEVPANRLLRPGKGDFSLAVWVHTGRELDDALGDVLSLYDPVKRRGVTLCVQNSAGVTTSQANHRNVHFGIDDGTAPKWTDRGRPGKAVYVLALAVHGGGLYAGTCESGKGETGHVYRFDGGKKWTDCGSPDGANAVTALAEFDGKLYAGTGKYRLAGSALPESPNTTPGGKVFRHEGGTKWADCGRLPDTEAVGGLVVFGGKLLASSLYRPAGLFRYQSGSKWEKLPTPKGGERVVPLGVFNGKLYAGSYDACTVFRRDENGWLDMGKLEPSGQTYSFAVHHGELFVGTWPNGKVFRLDRGGKWADAGRLGDEKEVMGMSVYNGKLYAGTLPLAEVYRYESDGRWTKTGRLDHTKDVRYRRAWTSAVYQGELFFGTLPSGHVHSMEAGKVVTSDRALPAGWHHVAALRHGDRLKLYLDGKLEATSTALGKETFDLSGDSALRIGAGPNDHFNGRLRDLRFYKRALSAEEVAALARAR